MIKEKSLLVEEDIPSYTEGKTVRAGCTAMQNSCNDIEPQECDGVFDDPVTEGQSLEDSIMKTASQWSDMDGRIIPVSNTFPRLERGYYSIAFSQQLGMYFIKNKIELNKLYRLPN